MMMMMMMMIDFYPYFQYLFSDLSPKDETLSNLFKDPVRTAQ